MKSLKTVFSVTQRPTLHVEQCHLVRCGCNRVLQSAQQTLVSWIGMQAILSYLLSGGTITLNRFGGTSALRLPRIGIYQYEVYDMPKKALAIIFPTFYPLCNYQYTGDIYLQSSCAYCNHSPRPNMEYYSKFHPLLSWNSNSVFRIVKMLVKRTNKFCVFSLPIHQSFRDHPFFSCFSATLDTLANRCALF